MNAESPIRVGQVMTPQVRTIGRTATIREAVTIMRQIGVSSLVVERRDEADEFGLLVVTDIAREVIGKDRSADRVNVYEVMTKPVLTLPAEMDIKYAVRLLTRFQLTRALVLDNDRGPVGIVTLRDMVLRHIGDEPQE